MKKLITIYAIVCVCLTGTLHAAVTIDFEAYTDGQNLHGVNLGGVTLTHPVNGNVEVYDDRFGVSYHSSTKAVGSFDGCNSVNPIVGVFDVPTTYVSLWAGDGGGDYDQWRLVAYDAAVGGNMVGSVTSPSWTGSPYTQLSITGPNIMRFEAYSIGQACGIGFDDLEFQPIPTPGAVLLGSIGVGLVGWLKRRRSL